jgi:hypothetical protein
LGTKTHLGANWGSQTYTHRIREEREYDTCQHLIGPLQCHVSAPHWSTSARWAPPWYKSLTGGPHLSATWQSASGPPPPLCATWHNHRKPPHPLCATWHHTTKPPHSACATWHNITRPPHSVNATWHYTTEPPQRLLTRSLMLKRLCLT